MLNLLAAGKPLLIAGIRDRYLLAAVLVVAAAGLILWFRSRRPGLQITRLDASEAARYATAFAAIEADFDARPQVAVGRARGTVEEVMRRMGYPDRIDADQRVKDLGGRDRQAAGAYKSSAKDAAGGDVESWRRAMLGYREVLDRLLAPAPPP